MVTCVDDWKDLFKQKTYETINYIHYHIIIVATMMS